MKTALALAAAALILMGGAAAAAGAQVQQFATVPAQAGPKNGPVGYGGTNARGERRALRRAHSKLIQKSHSRGETA